MSRSDLFAFIAVTINVLTVMGAAYASWKNSLKKSFAAEREFSHLARNQEQIKEAVKQLQDESEQAERQLYELKGLIEGLRSKP